MGDTDTPTRLIAGAMSGTSADGVDVALVRVGGRGYDMTAQLVAHHAAPYDPRLRARVFAAREPGATTTLRTVAELSRDVALAYAAAVNAALRDAGASASDLTAVAAHGQTLFHDPPLTLQLIDPALLAARVGATVVSDFRRADCAAGGQGAPLVPFADYVLFRDPAVNRTVVNIGGIANLTYLPAGGTPADVVALDTGPGNCVCDWLCRTLWPAGPGYDAGGTRALRGRVLPDLYERLTTRGLAHPYFARVPPKSTDGPEMIAAFRAALGREPKADELDDLLATAARHTAHEIVAQQYAFASALVDEFVVAGGGARNAAIMAHLRAAAGGTRVVTSDELNVPTEAREAIAFALLAAATLDWVPANVPNVTGAVRAVVLGSVTPKPYP